MMYLLFLAFFALYWIVPLPIKAILLVANGLVPDPIPVLDEVIMLAVFLNRLSKIIVIQTFIGRHKIVSFFIFIAIAVGMVSFVTWLLTLLGIR